MQTEDLLNLYSPHHAYSGGGAEESACQVHIHQLIND